jgi:acyl-coenzyme A thioesterase PaaI-like protein
MTQRTGVQSLHEPATTDFDRTTSLVPVEGRPGEFVVELDAGWLSLAGVHGGYLCALAVRGAQSLAPDRMVRTVTTSFLRSGRVGPATLSVKVIRQGRSLTTVGADITQDGALVATSRLTLLAARSGVEWNTPVFADLPGALCADRSTAGCRPLRSCRCCSIRPPFTATTRVRWRPPAERRPVDPVWLPWPRLVPAGRPCGSHHPRGVSIDISCMCTDPLWRFDPMSGSCASRCRTAAAASLSTRQIAAYGSPYDRPV